MVEPEKIREAIELIDWVFSLKETWGYNRNENPKDIKKAVELTKALLYDEIYE